MKRFTEFKINNKIKINEQEVSVPQTDASTEVKKDGVTSFFSKLFEARQMAHIFHLQVKGEMGSGWEHDALNEFYTEILEFTDDLIETYQGQYGIVEGYEIIDTSSTGQMKSLDYLKITVDYIRKERTAILSEDTHLHNIIDEIIALCYKTIYKLTNLK